MGIDGMGLSFQATLPQTDSGRLMMDLPPDICSKIEDKTNQKVNVIINGTGYICNLYNKDNGLFSLHLIRALKRDVGLGNSVIITLEFTKKDQPATAEIDEMVLNWEMNHCTGLMKKVGIKEGDSVIDFGCGHGHYTLPCALVLSNSGKVYAVDFDSNALNWTRAKIDRFHIENTEVIKTEGPLTINFPDESIDVVLMYDIIHIVKSQNDAEIPIRLPLYQEACRVLKKGGILSVLSFDSEIKKISTRNSSRGKTTQQDIIAEILDFGFAFSHQVDGGVHFDWYHSNYRMKKGVLFEQLEKGTIYNFIKF